MYVKNDFIFLFQPNSMYVALSGLITLAIMATQGHALG